MVWVPRLGFDLYCEGKWLLLQDKSTSSINSKKNFLQKLWTNFKKLKNLIFSKTAQPILMTKMYVIEGFWIIFLMWNTSWTPTVFSISCSNSKWQYIFFRKISERYFIVKKKKLFFPLQCMEQLMPYDSLKQLFLYSWKFYVDHVQYLIYEIGQNMSLFNKWIKKFWYNSPKFFFLPLTYKFNTIFIDSKKFT